MIIGLTRFGYAVLSALLGLALLFAVAWALTNVEPTTSAIERGGQHATTALATAVPR